MGGTRRWSKCTGVEGSGVLEKGKCGCVPRTAERKKMEGETLLSHQIGKKKKHEHQRWNFNQNIPRVCSQGEMGALVLSHFFQEKTCRFLLVMKKMILEKRSGKPGPNAPKKQETKIKGGTTHGLLLRRLKRLGV